MLSRHIARASKTVANQKRFLSLHEFRSAALLKTYGVGVTLTTDSKVVLS
ncbi:unnamed protein product [Debaryomyces tyrocola]|nr:unnamed protein product [Debaryomyces tyrocola]